MMTSFAARTAVALCLIPLWAPPAAAQEPDPARMLSLVGSYLDVLDRMGKLSADPRRRCPGQNSIKEVYEQKGRKAQAVPELRKILDRPGGPGGAHRRTLRDRRHLQGVRAEGQGPGRAAAIVAENKAVLGRRR